MTQTHHTTDNALVNLLHAAAKANQPRAKRHPVVKAPKTYTAEKAAVSLVKGTITTVRWTGWLAVMALALPWIGGYCALGLHTPKGRKAAAEVGSWLLGIIVAVSAVVG